MINAILEDMFHAALRIVKLLELKEKLWENTWENTMVDAELSIIQNLNYHFEIDLENQKIKLEKLGIKRIYHYNEDYDIDYLER